MTQYYKMQDLEGNTIEDANSLVDLIFPPKAWMTDSAQERCMTFAAAALARGKLLIGGLGLAIYPQFALLLKRPLTSITIVENNRDVIDLVGNDWFTWLKRDGDIPLNIVEDSIEHYLQQSTDSFDTIYLDTWEDGDPRFLPHINYLCQLALPRCAPDGQIQCWAYAMQVDTLVRDAVMYVDKEFDLTKFYLDPGLTRYADWLQTVDRASLTHEEIKQVAREIALTTVVSLADYTRDNCFTPYAPSRHAGRINWARSRKPDPDQDELDPDENAAEN